MDKMKKVYFQLKNKIKLYNQINWIKTIYINFKMLSFYQAKKLPIVIFGKCAFKNLDGKIFLEGKAYFGRIVIGQRYQLCIKEKGISEFQIIGELTFKGRMQFGTDCQFYVAKNAVCIFGDMSSMGNSSTLICTQKITFGKFCRAGAEAYFADSNFHSMKNTITGEVYPKSFEIELGNYNFIGTRVTILGKTKTPDYCTIASSTLSKKNFYQLGRNILLGGIPAKLVKEQIVRDWEGERASLEKYLKIL